MSSGAADDNNELEVREANMRHASILYIKKIASKAEFGSG